MEKFSLGRVILFSTITVVLSFFASIVIAEGNLLDYQRALSLRRKTANKVYKQRVEPHWFDDNIRFWYKNDLPDKKCEFIIVNAQTGEKNFAFDHKRLAEAISKAFSEQVNADKLPIDKLQFEDSETSFSFTCRGKRFNCDLQSYQLTELAEDNTHKRVEL